MRGANGCVYRRMGVLRWMFDGKGGYEMVGRMNRGV